MKFNFQEAYEKEMIKWRANCPHDHQRWINQMRVCVECGEVLK
jgi:hypothetical protein